MSAISAVAVPPSFDPKPAPTPVPAAVRPDPDGDQAGSQASTTGPTGRRLNIVA